MVDLEEEGQAREEVPPPVQDSQVPHVKALTVQILLTPSEMVVEAPETPPLKQMVVSVKK
jgi:hypothetical protein